MSDARVWAAVKNRSDGERGFDADVGGWSDPRTWANAAGDPEAATAAVIGAVAEVTGFLAVIALDPGDEGDRKKLCWLAADLEEAATALREMCDDRAAPSPSE